MKYKFSSLYKVLNFNNCIQFQDEIGLKEWALSLRTAHKQSQEILGSMAKKAGKIYGTERDAATRNQVITGTSLPPKNQNGSN